MGKKGNRKLDDTIEILEFEEDIVARQVQQKKKNRHSILLLTSRILTIIIIVCIFIFGIFGVYRMNGKSMFPSFKDGSLLLFYRLDHSYTRGDVVVVKRDNRYQVYRITGISGDSISIVNNILFINGYQENTVTFYDTEENSSKKIEYPYKVIQDEFFVTNDYRNDSNDSRKFGSISKDEIVGRVIFQVQIRDF